MTGAAILTVVFLILLFSSGFLDLFFLGLGAWMGLVEPTKSPGLRNAGLVIAIGGPLLICLSLVLFGVAVFTNVHAFYEVAALLFAFATIAMFGGGLVLTVWKACGPL
ncbi:hypothetical protein ETAA8_28740 [Anatilimnocola aggregata]|uniref:Uncharacterized protein n=1 Tax=Anatilimnocola aggregata TaxID=2528021 RepID=A0A517YC08_9BACT|nr:hypothetical protein [Anatilimnocola aggregata]QDU27783.1 hypothetical protein ETAA8_28740 [Anatilimnocola aggregata]